MYMRMLLQPRRCSKGLPALRTSMWSSSHVMLPDVPLQITGISEYLQMGIGWVRKFCLTGCAFYLGAVFTMVFSVLAVDNTLVFDQTGFVGVGLRTKLATVFISPVVVLHNQMVVQSMERKRITLNNGHKRQYIILMMRGGVLVGDYLCEFRQV